MSTHARFNSNPLVIAGAVLTRTLSALGGSGSLFRSKLAEKGMIFDRDYAKPAEGMPLAGMTLLAPATAQKD